MKNLAAGVSTFVLAAMIAVPAGAQSPSDTASTAPQAKDPDVQNGKAIEEIVVTATRQNASLQKVPLSITALTNDRLTQSNTIDLKAIATISPGIQIQQPFAPGNVIFQIRGQLQGDTNPAIDPSVGVYFDDVYIARSQGSLVNLVDMARVEVLKGPQGTLFGKNTTGGAIRLVSNRPTENFEGYVQGSYERFNRKRLESVLNVPLSSFAALRLVGLFDDTDGYGHNAVTGKRLDQQRTYFTRGSLLLKPASDLTILLQGDYTKTKGGGTVNYNAHYEPAAGPTSGLEYAIENNLWNLNPATRAAAVSPG